MAALDKWDILRLTAGGILFTMNFISMLLLCKCKKLASQIKILSISLAITDFSVGIFSIMKGLKFHAISVVTCRIVFHSQIVLNVVTSLIITAFAFDRFLAICFPLQYFTKRSKKVIIISVLIWIISIFVSLLTIIKNDPFSHQKCSYIKEVYGPIGFQVLAVLWACVLLLNIIFYVSIFVILSPWRRESLPLDNDFLARRLNLQVRILMKILGVTVLFVVCYTPYFVIYILMAIQYDERQTYSDVFFITVLIRMGNSFFNPFIYVWRFKECRRILFRAICILRERREDTNTGTQASVISVIQSEI